MSIYRMSLPFLSSVYIKQASLSVPSGREMVKQAIRSFFHNGRNPGLDSRAEEAGGDALGRESGREALWDSKKDPLCPGV